MKNHQIFQYSTVRGLSRKTLYPIMYFPFLLVLVLLTPGCKDFLSEDNRSNMEADEYYTTAEGYERLVNAVYSSMRDVYQDPWLFCAGTDMYVEGRSQQPPGVSEYQNLTPDDGEVLNFYTRAYNAIQICNTAMYFNDHTEETDVLSVRRGEVQFLRAYYYFLLAQNFGGVSLVTGRSTEPVMQYNRNTAEEVYDFVIGEMEAALELVPESSDQFGRVTKRVVRHFLSKAYLTRGYEEFGRSQDFDEAARLADAAIAGQGLTLSFEDVFWPGNEENEEVIFSIQFDEESMENPQSGGHNQNYWFGPYLGGQGAAEGYPNRAYRLCPTMYTFDLFTETDARFDASFMVTYYERYYDYYDRQGALEELNVRFYYPPEWLASEGQIQAWRAEDPERRGNAQIRPYSPAWEASRTTELDNETPIVKKFDDPGSVFSGEDGGSTRDFFLARLGETYLVAAEAYLQSGDPGTAAERINEVRRRAAKEGTENQMLITAGEVDIDFILDERGRELLGEYHRWPDLKRTGKLMERTELYNRDIRNWYNQGDPFLGTDGNYKILRPVPRQAMDLNEGEFAQNPGYQ